MSVVIAGGGPNGILAALALRRFQPLLVEGSNSLGGTWGQGGVQYLHATPHAIRFLDEFKIPYSPRRITAGIIRAGASSPDCIQDLSIAAKSSTFEIDQRVHYQKSRGTLVGFSPRATMNEYAERSEPEMALDFDYHEIIRQAEASLESRLFLRSMITGIDTHNQRVMWFDETKDRHGAIHLNYTRLVTTLGAGLFARFANVNLGAMQKPGMVKFGRILLAPWQKSLMSTYDYVYTVETPNYAIYRVSLIRQPGPQQQFWVEARPEAEIEDLIEDLRWIFNGCSILEYNFRDVPARVIQPPCPPDYPWRVYPLGRAAEVNPRSLLSTSIEALWRWNQEW